ncbi:G5 domain-containing protein, partial [Streptococcus sp. 202]
MSRQSTKNKKYALRKIGKFFGSCAVATVITLSGAAIMAPNVTVYASYTLADENKNIEDFSSSASGYEVIIPKGKQYIRNDEIESNGPVLKTPGHNGRSFIVPKDENDSHFFDHPMSELFTKLYDKDGDVDEKYKNPEPVDNSHAGEEIDGKTVPYRSEINPKYPHVVDSGLTGDETNKPGVWKYNPDGKYEASDGVINDQDTIVVARRPFTVNENAEENVVNDDGSVVLSSHYSIHVNKGDHIDKEDDVYEVGTKPKVVETPIDYPTRYERDDNIPEGEEHVEVAGKAGKTVTTTTYKLNETTGEVTPNEPETVTTDPVTKVVKRGTQPKVVETPIDYPTRYERDDNIPEGEEHVEVAGKAGKTVTTTTYKLNETTGEVTPNEPETVTTDPVTKVVKRGTQPKPGETPETPQPKP